jgi:hypothetical protein
VTAVWITVAVVVVALAALLPVLAGRRTTRGGGAATSARARYALLGHYVENPVPATDPTADDLLRRATERWHTCGGLLASARSTEDYALAQGVADEGMTLVTRAYAALGLPVPPH